GGPGQCLIAIARRNQAQRWIQFNGNALQRLAVNVELELRVDIDAARRKLVGDRLPQEGQRTPFAGRLLPQQANVEPVVPSDLHRSLNFVRSLACGLGDDAMVDDQFETKGQGDLKLGHGTSW